MSQLCPLVIAAQLQTFSVPCPSEATELLSKTDPAFSRHNKHYLVKLPRVAKTTLGFSRFLSRATIPVPLWEQPRSQVCSTSCLVLSRDRLPHAVAQQAQDTQGVCWACRQVSNIQIRWALHVSSALKQNGEPFLTPSFLTHPSSKAKPAPQTIPLCYIPCRGNSFAQEKPSFYHLQIPFPIPKRSITCLEAAKPGLSCTATHLRLQGEQPAASWAQPAMHAAPQESSMCSQLRGPTAPVKWLTQGWGRRAGTEKMQFNVFIPLHAHRVTASPCKKKKCCCNARTVCCCCPYRLIRTNSSCTIKK